MATVAKTVVATGVSSGLGLEAISQLLTRPNPYKVLLGARDLPRTQKAYDAITHGSPSSSVTILPVELSDLKGVRRFAQQALEKLGDERIDYLLLNAAISDNAEKPGDGWCETYTVNHLSQHYLIHLLREKLVASKSRIIVVSSGGIRGVSDPTKLDTDLKAGSGAGARTVYGETKFAQLLSAHWWRRQLKDQCTVVAVSPGLIPTTGLGRGWNMSEEDMQKILNHPDAKSIPEGAANILRAFDRDDLPEDPEQIFLTSWGEWWPKDVYSLTLDKDLQEKWSPSKEQLENEAGLAS